MKISVVPLKKEYEIFLDNFPPIPANKYLPDWYKEANLGKQIDTLTDGPNPKTAKKCPAIQDMVSTGLVIPLWGLLSIRSIYDDEDNMVEQKWNFTASQGAKEPLDMHLDSHPNIQTKGMDIGKTIDKRTLKIQMPYRFIVEEGYNVFYFDPFYHFRKHVQLLPAMVEVDKWGSVAFPFSILSDNFVLEPGVPMAQAYFYKRADEKIEFDIRTGSEKEYEEYDIALRKLLLTQKNYRTEK